MDSINDHDLDELTCQTEEAFSDRIDHEFLDWAGRIGTELIKGRPLSISDLAGRLQVSEEKVQQIIDVFHNIERDETGKIVGLGGFTLRPTRHRCTLDNQVFYVWCAGDSLGFPVLLDHPVEVASSCYATNSSITLTVTPDSVQNLSPTGAVVSVIIPDEVPQDIRGFYCDRVNYFKSGEVAENWLSRNDDGVVMPVEEAYRYYRKTINRIEHGQ